MRAGDLVARKEPTPGQERGVTIAVSVLISLAAFGMAADGSSVETTIVGVIAGIFFAALAYVSWRTSP